MKKIVSMLLILALMMSLFSLTAFATDFDSGLGDWDSSNPCGANLVWSLADGVLTISGTGAMTDWTTAGQNVPWTGSKSEITKVVICDGVTTIGGRAFQDMTALDCVILPETLSSVGAYAFAGCTELDDICFAGTKQQYNGISVPATAGLSDKKVYFVEQVDEHWIAYVDATSATCETDGNTEYWFCPECDAYFADADAENAITADAVIVPALNHNYVQNICSVCHKANPDAGIKVVSFGTDFGAVNWFGAAYSDGKLIGVFEAVSFDDEFFAAIPNALYSKMDTAKLFQLDAYFAPICNAGVFEK